MVLPLDGIATTAADGEGWIEWLRLSPVYPFRWWWAGDGFHPVGRYARPTLGTLIRKNHLIHSILHFSSVHMLGVAGGVRRGFRPSFLVFSSEE